MKILCLIFIMMMLITGCSAENKVVEAKQENNEQNIEVITDNSKTPVEQIMDNALTDSIKNADGDEIVLKDKLFIAQCNDIYLNPDEYMGKTIRWEGIYTEATNPETNQTFKFVIRYGPGCCGNDGTAGFEILYDGEPPKINDWVEASGKIEMIEENGEEFVAIRLSELKVLDVRGQEFVSN
ncbi:MAG: hypothetical protein K0R07_1142 [Sedimentibacter sp.]|nr:hypothetical protein [Sedimentibacter sp.]